MPKKNVKKKIPVKTKNLEKSVMENSVALQRVLTNLSLELNSLSKKLSKLLDLFESSAKVLAEKDSLTEKSRRAEKEIVEKLNTLTDQNKIIARGLTLLHEANLNSEEFEEPQQEQPRRPQQIQRPMPQQFQGQQQPPQKQKTMEMGNYQKSISSK